MIVVVRKEVIKGLDSWIGYPIPDNKWMSHVQYVPKKGGMIVVMNQKNELIPTQTVIGWRTCTNFRLLMTPQGI